MGSQSRSITSEAGFKPGGAMPHERDSKEDMEEDRPHDPLREWVRMVLDAICWLRDVVVNYAQVFGMLLFILAGAYSGYMLLYAMLGHFGIAGTILAILFAGAGVAVFAYLDHVEDLEEAQIEREVEEDYQLLKDEEQRLLEKVKREGEEREEKERWKEDILLAEFGDDFEFPPIPSEEDIEAMLLEADEVAERTVDKLASIQKLRGLRDRLVTLSTQKTEEAMARQAQVLEKLYNISELSTEAVSERDEESSSEIATTREAHGDETDLDKIIQDATRRRETLRRRVAKNAADTNESIERADVER